MKLEFQSQNPHKTRSLVISFNKNENPDPIVSALTEIGWEAGNKLPGNDRIPSEISLSRPGTDIFRSWKKEEEKVFLKEAEKVLKTFGIKNIPYRKLTFAECL